MKYLLPVLFLIITTASIHAATWDVLVYDGAGRKVVPYLSSLAGGETGTGAVRSDVFQLDADIISLEICGADARPGTRSGKSWFALIDAESGLALRRAEPTQNDSMMPVVWDVVELIGKNVYFRAVDAADDTMFAWIGWRNVRVGDRELMPDLRDRQMPPGWHEEMQPENTPVNQWLNVKTSPSGYGIEKVKTQSPTWGIMTINGELKKVPPYLSSLRGGETGMGAVRSPEFVLDTPIYTFLANGADGMGGDLGLNSFQLIDATTHEVLRTMEPPVGCPLIEKSFDTADLIGRKVYFRAVDGNNAGGWAWLGCNMIPVGGGKVLDFASDDTAIDGWWEESQPVGTPVGTTPAMAQKSPEETLIAQWEAQDLQNAIRWDLWETNEKAAPYILKRLKKAIDGDFVRGDYLLRDFINDGLKGQRNEEIQTQLDNLMTQYQALGSDTKKLDEWKALRRKQQIVLRELTFMNPRLNFAHLLFVKRNTQQSYADINVNHHAWGSRPGGDICLLSDFIPDNGKMFAEPRVQNLINKRLGPGNVHGIDLSWDGKRIVFAYARSESEEPPDGWLSRQETFRLHRTVGLLHLYEMNIDGTDLRQLTDGEWSDLNPCYMPGGEIAFESERCGFEINCNENDKDEPTTNLFIMNADGTNIRHLAITKDGDWYPRVNHDGAIIYSHWEYHERGLMHVHPLWAIRPDGTGADVYNKQHFDYPVTLTVPRPIPDSPRIMAIAGGHHTLACGPVVIVDRAMGPNDPDGVLRLTGPDVWPEIGGAASVPNVPGWKIPPGQGWYMDPWPLSETTFIVSYCDGGMQDEAGYGLYLMDAYGGKELLYQDTTISSVMPLAVAPRKLPPLVADVRNKTADDATCIVTDVYSGVPELERGSIKYIRIAEPVPWPFTNETGGLRYEPDAKSEGVNWTPIRILGTVPVEEDGSASFKIPPLKELYFQALDSEGRELRRMRSYVSFQAGETRSCNGCHETQGRAPSLPRGFMSALRKEPSVPKPPLWGSERALSFLADIQPVLNRNCLSCHTGLKPAGGADLSPGLTITHNRAYDTLVWGGRGLLAVSNKGDNSRITPIYEFGALASRLTKVIEAHIANKRCELSAMDMERLYTWMDSNAVYHDDFLHRHPASALGYSFVTDEVLWNKIREIQQQRCGSCHDVNSITKPEWVDLQQPENSLFLTAPLAGVMTPNGKKCPEAIYKSTDDTDYLQILELLKEASHRSFAQPRRDLRCMVTDPSLRIALSFVTRSQFIVHEDEKLVLNK